MKPVLQPPAAATAKKNKSRVEPKRSSRNAEQITAEPARRNARGARNIASIEIQGLIEAPSHSFATSTSSPLPTLGVEVGTTMHRISDCHVDTYK